MINPLLRPLKFSSYGSDRRTLNILIFLSHIALLLFFVSSICIFLAFAPGDRHSVGKKS